jgi:hypothetical protein
LIIDGWFHERGVLWPGQGMLLHFVFHSFFFRYMICII